MPRRYARDEIAHQRGERSLSYVPHVVSSSSIRVLNGDAPTRMKLALDGVYGILVDSR